MPYINTIDINGEVYYVANLTDGEHVVNLPLLNNDDTFLLRGDVIDGLASTLVGKPLSANQGKILNEKIDTAITAFQNTVDNISKRMIPITRGISSDGIAYTATGDDLPTVQTGSHDTQTDPVGKGRQIVFVPMLTNNAIAPTLQINGGEIIPIRLRAPKNQGSNDQSPDATLPVPVGALMRGVPYTLTFCGKYWLVDSMISQFDWGNENILNIYASALMRLYEGDTVAVPIINSMDEGVDDGISTMYIRRSTSENNTPDQSGDVTVPTEKRVEEMIRKDITSDYAAWTPESGTEKTVENYAKTLPDGSYRIADDTIGRYEIEVFTVMNGEQWRILREHDDQFCYIIFYCGETLSILIDTETCDVQVGGRKMLTDWNIPLPTAADVGKVLTASAAGRAAWTSVTNAEEVAV